MLVRVCVCVCACYVCDGTWLSEDAGYNSFEYRHELVFIRIRDDTQKHWYMNMIM